MPPSIDSAEEAGPGLDDVLANQKGRNKLENWERARFLVRSSSFTSSVLRDGRAGIPAVSDKEQIKTFQDVPTNLQLEMTDTEAPGADAREKFNLESTSRVALEIDGRLEG
ncbi:hypothetical protein Pcinc_007401 [Petrolisthes cinctipes]|uniref:Uncharacterized protein n=1 Tax=Petrolisthes cinctipes TaxID=88211 RepID=A0AAE1KXF7_PETCI|nr:hypothetical protein Pcinc_007401 [Petrolisthes cinctipes]